MANLGNSGKRSTPRASAKLNTTAVDEFLRRRGGLVSLVLVLGFLAVWEAFAQTGKLSKILFPAPSLIFASFFNGLLDGEYTQDLKISFTRIISGFLVGGGAGMVLGLLMGWSRRLRAVLDPIIAGLHPIPKFAVLPLVIIFLGIGESSRIALVGLGAFFPLVINSMDGVLQIAPTYYDVLESYGATRFDIFRKVVWPGSLPFVLTGARLSLRNALTLTIGIEMVFGNKGLGSALWLSWETMRMVDMYSILLIVVMVGVGMVGVLEILKRVLIPWHQENHRSG
jgi:ABC-type nitrate/sulfonate/bicarbonate transport system permease component